MPILPWRFTAGQTAYVRPATPDYKVTLIEQVPHTDPKSNIMCPHWAVRDIAGDEYIVSQLELSSRPTVLKKDGTVKLLQGAVK
jgi:hypothetical protein